MADTNLQILLTLKDDASAAMSGFASKMKSVGDQISSVGRTLTTDITLPIVGIATGSALLASNFEDAMLKVQTGAGGSAQEVKNMSQALLDMASNGAQQTPVQLANGLYYVESAGFHGADALNLLKTAMDGADVSGVDLNTVAQQLVTIMNATHTPMSDAENIMALLNSTVGQGVMTMQDLIGAMSTGIIPKAQTMGLGIKDVAAALDTMTRSGVPAQDGATRLGMTLSLMEAPTTGATTALKKIGITSNELADEMRSKGLLPALEDLQQHLVDSGKTATEQAQILSKVFGGGRTSGTAELLLQNLDQFKQASDALMGGAANFTSYVQAQGETTAAYFARMKASAAAAGTDIGNALAPLEAQIFPMISAAIRDVTKWFDSLGPSGQRTVIVIVALIAAAGPVLVVLGSLITVLGTLTAAIPFVVAGISAIGSALMFLAANPIGIIIVAIGALIVAIALIATHWNEVSGFLLDNWKLIVSIMFPGLGSLAVLFIDNFGKIKDFVMGVINAITTGIKNLMSMISSLGSALSNIGKSVGGAVGGAFNAVNSVIPKFATGGIVNSPTLAMIGEAGPEAVIPLSAFRGGSSLSGGSGSGNSGNIIININGGQFSDPNSTRKLFNEMARQINQKLKLRTV